MQVMNSQQAKVAVYAQTDWPVMQALTRAADRGVKVRVYLDGAQLVLSKPMPALSSLGLATVLILRRATERKEAPQSTATDRVGIGPASSSKLQSARGLRLDGAGAPLTTRFSARSGETKPERSEGGSANTPQKAMW